jgi:hypothetical protein
MTGRVDNGPGGDDSRRMTAAIQHLSGASCVLVRRRYVDNMRSGTSRCQSTG